MAVGQRSDLRCAPRDLGWPERAADQMSELLRANGYDAVLRIGDYWSPEQARTSLSQWSEDIQFRVDDVALFYFAGCCSVGADGRHSLLCRGGRDGDPDVTALATEDVAGILVRNGLRRLLFVLDAHYPDASHHDAARAALLGIARRTGDAASNGIWFLSAAHDPGS